MDKSVRRLLAHLRETGVALNPGIGLDAIEEFERAHKVKLPRGIAELLQTGNGMQEGMDGNGFRLWSLEEIIPLDLAFCADPAHERPGYFVFMDYMVGSHGYAVDMTSGRNGGQVLLADGDASRRVAGTLEEFWGVFVAAPLSLI